MGVYLYFSHSACIRQRRHQRLFLEAIYEPFWGNCYRIAMDSTLSNDKLNRESTGGASYTIWLTFPQKRFGKYLVG